MSSTIESMNSNIYDQIYFLSMALEILYKYCKENDIVIINQSLIELKKLNTSYISVTTPILLKYYKNSHENKKIIYNEFIKSFNSIGIINELKRIYSNCKRIEKKYNIKEQNLQEYFRKYEFSSVDETFEDITNDSCKQCKEAYIIDENTSEYSCPKCGITFKMYGEVFEDEQFFYQEGSRTKHGKYDPTKHCKFWIDRIQGKENIDIDESIINKLKKCIRNDNIYIDAINCETIRKYLKVLKITNYNNNIPLILKKITKKDPPQFTNHELEIIYMYFNKVIQIFNRTKPIEVSNCPYHPYFIYKIVEQILNKSHQKNRKKEILSNIHLQSEETLIENDRIWFIICDHIPEFTKITTKK